MKPVKRIEIIIDHVALRHVTTLLEKEGFGSYTVIPETTGKGDRGARSGDGLSGEFNNAYLLLACPDSDAPRLVELIRPLLKKFGGICLLSDAEWVKH